jgi:hypothetical protein
MLFLWGALAGYVAGVAWTRYNLIHRVMGTMSKSGLLRFRDMVDAELRRRVS